MPSRRIGETRTGRPATDLDVTPTAPGAGLRGSAQEVAKLAGVSECTVSRVFTRTRFVSEKTCERVMTAARQLGYTPNAASRTLRTGKVDVFALVTQFSLFGEFLPSLAGGLQDALRERQFELLLSVIPPGHTAEMWLRRLVSSARCGAIAALAETTPRCDFDLFAQLGVPVTVLNHVQPSDTQTLYGSVGFDQVAGVQRAVRHLCSLGHRKIAFFCAEKYPNNFDAELREQGFRMGMQEAGLPTNEAWIIPSPAVVRPENPGTVAFNQLFSQPGEKPSAVICGSDYVCFGAMAGARRWGIGVPQNLSVVGFDDDLWTAQNAPRVTTVHHSGYELGRAAGTELLARYDAPETQPKNIVLETQLIIRESTAPPI